MFDWQTGVTVRTLLDEGPVAYDLAIRGIALTPVTGILIVLDCRETEAFQQRKPPLSEFGGGDNDARFVRIREYV